MPAHLDRFELHYGGRVRANSFAGATAHHVDRRTDHYEGDDDAAYTEAN